VSIVGAWLEKTNRGELKMSSESKYFDEGRHLTEAGKEAFKNLLEVISPE